jgi:hypothetical protein
VFLAGIRGLIGYILNTLVAFTGFLVAIAAGVGQHYMSEDCPAGEDCSNSAVYIAVCMVRVTKSRSVLTSVSGSGSGSVGVRVCPRSLSHNTSGDRQGVVLIVVGCLGVFGIRKNAKWPSLTGRKLMQWCGRESSAPHLCTQTLCENLLILSRNAQRNQMTKFEWLLFALV